MSFGVQIKDPIVLIGARKFRALFVFTYKLNNFHVKKATFCISRKFFISEKFVNYGIIINLGIYLYCFCRSAKRS